MYKKLKLLVILFCLSSGSILAQNIQVLMSSKPSPYISDWQNRSETVKMIITNPGKKDIMVKIKTELFDGKGSLVANTDVSKMPELTVPPGITTYNPEDIFPTNAITYKGNLEKTAITTGRIPDDNYKLCVTLVDPQSSKPVGTSGTVCKMFTIVAFQAPVLLAPANKAEISEAGTKSIVFKWSPLTPSSNSIVTYRLQVWEVISGQDNMTTLKTNPPIVEKDLKGVFQTIWPIEFPSPEAGKKYVWTITPLDEENRKLVDGSGFSEPFGFTIGLSKIECNINNSELSVSLGSNGKLTICGTSGVDDVLIRLDPTGKKIKVDNLSNGAGTDYSFDLVQVRSIHIFLFAGNDRVIFDDTNGSLGTMLPLEINVGDGDNTVIGSTGSLTAGEIADLGNTITKLKKVLEASNDIREHTEQLNRRGAEITAYYEMKFLKEAERFSVDAPNQLDSITNKLKELLGVRKGEKVEDEQEWYTKQIEQFEKSFRLAQEKNEKHINNVLFQDAAALAQRLEKYANSLDTSEAGQQRNKELIERIEMEIDSFEQVYNKLNLPGQEDISKIDSDLKRLLAKLTNIGDSLLGWSETKFMSDNDKDWNDTISIGSSRFVMSDKKLLDGINSMKADAEAIERETNLLLEKINELIGKMGAENKNKRGGPRGGGCSFTTTNSITGSGFIIGTSANDDMTGSSGFDLMIGLGGSNRMHGGGGIDIMIGGSSSDDMFGDGGWDLMFGMGGDDCMSGGDSSDFMLGMSGKDIMHGNGGQPFSFYIYAVLVEIEVGDFMWGNGEDDEMHGDEGWDWMFGNSGKDVMHGDDCQDIMFGGSDDDDMWGEDGGCVKIDGIQVYPGNFMMGESGLDKMWGGDHRDFMLGNQDKDIMSGGKAMDFMDGGDEDDKMNGDDGFDVMFGGSGKDLMHGNDGFDVMTGNSGDDEMYGDDGFDVMWGRAGDDKMDGNDGFDLMFGGNDKDAMHGDNGLDVMFGNDGEDEMWGDDGWDWMCGGDKNDKMHGGNFTDFMFGNQCNDMMWGDDGLDFMEGGKEDDIMYGGDGVDLMLGNNNNDCMNGGNDPDFMFGGAGNDVMFGNDNMDWMAGNSGNDEMDGGNGVEAMWGGQDNDRMFGSNDFDVMLGNEGSDIMDGGNGVSFIEGNDDNDVIHGGNSLDILLGGSGDDCIEGNDLMDIMSGGDGNDNLLGGDGSDWMFGRDNNDLMYGGNGFDLMTGGRGDDQMMGGDNSGSCCTTFQNIA